MRRLISGMALMAIAAAAQPAYDLLLKGGHVIDPKNGVSAVRDVAVAGGRIARVAADIPASTARQVIDAQGLYVTPGLVDLHAHMWTRPGTGRPGRNLSVHPDEYSFRTGVTTMVEPGTAGWQDFADLRARVVDRARTRVLVMLNILRSGMGTGKENDPAEFDPEGAARMAKAHPDLIVGFKTAHYEPLDWHAVDNLVKAGNLANLPVMVDFGRVGGAKTISTLVLDKLRPGDIYTHCYSGLRGELVDGKVSAVLPAARKRGVYFDIGHGGGSFFWNIAIPMAQQGFWPDSISTDMHHGSINAGMKDMLNVMSKILLLGVPLEDVIRMATWSPARQIRRTELGNLDAGAVADLALFRIERGKFGFIDSAGARNDGDRKLPRRLFLADPRPCQRARARQAPAQHAPGQPGHQRRRAVPGRRLSRRRQPGDQHHADVSEYRRVRNERAAGHRGAALDHARLPGFPHPAHHVPGRPSGGGPHRRGDPRRAGAPRPQALRARPIRDRQQRRHSFRRGGRCGDRGRRPPQQRAGRSVVIIRRASHPRAPRRMM